MNFWVASSKTTLRTTVLVWTQCFTPAYVESQINVDTYMTDGLINSETLVQASTARRPNWTCTHLFDSASDVVKQHFARRERRDSMSKVLFKEVVCELQALLGPVGPQVSVHYEAQTGIPSVRQGCMLCTNGRCLRVQLQSSKIMTERSTCVVYVLELCTGSPSAPMPVRHE